MSRERSNEQRKERPLTQAERDFIDFLCKQVVKRCT
jgi:hypothetical protein